MDTSTEAQITQLLQRVAQGDDHAREQLWEVVYPEVRRCAEIVMRNWRRDGVVSGSDLAQGIFEKLDRPEFYAAADGRLYFYGAVARAMTRLLVDEYRKQNAERRGGGGRIRLSLSEIGEPAIEPLGIDALEFEELIDKLRETSLDLHEVFVHRCLLGRSAGQIAQDLGVDESTIRRRWRATRAWIQREMAHAPDLA